ncbi:MAG: MerR family transcriptional regulator [Dehalobacter sp.]|nr:MerR family transcriptional regulator [Dehalobacter sp.]
MEKLYRMKEITQYTGVSKSSVLYYVSLGLLPEPTKKSKNMAYYPALYLQIIPVIRYLQENMHLPLGVIKGVIDGIGFERVTIENALHYYETFLSPLKQGEDRVFYNSDEFIDKSNLESDEIRQLKSNGLLFLSGSGFYSSEDLLVANAYKKLRDYGITFSDIKRLGDMIKELAYVVHELYHENAKGLNSEEEQKLTKVMYKELETMFGYLISKNMQVIYKEENK